MPCFHPLKGYRSKTVNPSGKRSIVFNPKEGFYDLPVDLPCGRCDGCKLERSRQWAIRLVHENQMHENSVFLTLTYSEENLPKDGSLHMEHFQKFMKSLRKAHFEEIQQISSEYGPAYSQSKFLTNPKQNLRFFHCGEYGENYHRPHYHACVFNLDFRDKEHYKGQSENKLYTSETLNSLWPYGFSTIGTVTFESAAYVARYIMKKVHGHDKEILYEGKKPEYVTMSRRPGIGKTWLEKYKNEIKRDDFVISRGIQMKPPKFYGTQFEREDPKRWAEIKANRKNESEKHPERNSWEQLKAKAFVTKQNLTRLKRSIEK